MKNGYLAVIALSLVGTWSCGGDDDPQSGVVNGANTGGESTSSAGGTGTGGTATVATSCEDDWESFYPDLQGCDLRGAFLNYADLTNADLTGAELQLGSGHG